MAAEPTAVDPDVADLIERLKAIGDERRQTVLKNFCRNCGTPIDYADWSGGNYCFVCSPDPRDD